MQCEDYRSRFLQQMHQLKLKEKRLYEMKQKHQDEAEIQNKLIEERLLEKDERATLMELAL